MVPRLKLSQLLKTTLGSDNVYFQPPQNIRMTYPAIVYALTDMDVIHANNDPYNIEKGYLVTLIGSDPDSEVINKLARLRKCEFNRQFVADGLYHTVYTIYY